MVQLKPGFFEKIENEDTVIGFCQDVIDQFEQEIENIYSEVYDIALYKCEDEEVDREITRCCNIMGVSVRCRIENDTTDKDRRRDRLKDLSNSIISLHTLLYEVEQWFKFKLTDDVFSWDDDENVEDTKEALSNLQEFVEGNPIELYKFVE